MTQVIVVGNGPSAEQYKDLLNQSHTVIGCNKGFTEFAVECFVVKDRMTMMEINDEYYLTAPGYTKERWLRNRKEYNIQQDWKELPVSDSGNSGSIAIDLASKFYPDSTIYVLGFDGCLDRTQYHNLYTYAHRNWATRTSEDTTDRHRREVLEVVRAISNPVYMVSDRDDPEFKCITHENFQRIITPKENEQCEDTSQQTSAVGGEDSKNTAEASEEL